MSGPRTNAIRPLTPGNAACADALSTSPAIAAATTATPDRNRLLILPLSGCSDESLRLPTRGAGASAGLGRSGSKVRERHYAPVHAPVNPRPTSRLHPLLVNR